MGLSASSAVSQVQNSMMMDLSQHCSPSNVVNQNVDCSGVGLQHCNRITLRCGNSATSSLTCSLQAVADATQKAAADASSQAQAAIGGAISKSSALTSNNIMAAINNSCSSVSDASQNVKANGFLCSYSSHDIIDFSNQTDNMSRCYMTAATSLIQKAAASTKSSAKGWDPVGEFFDTLSTGMKALLIGAIVIVCLVVVVIISILILRKSGSNDQLKGIIPAAAPAGPYALRSQAYGPNAGPQPLFKPLTAPIPPQPQGALQKPFYPPFVGQQVMPGQPQARALLPAPTKPIVLAAPAVMPITPAVPTAPAVAPATIKAAAPVVAPATIKAAAAAAPLVAPATIKAAAAPVVVPATIKAAAPLALPVPVPAKP